MMRLAPEIIRGDWLSAEHRNNLNYYCSYMLFSSISPIPSYNRLGFPSAGVYAPAILLPFRFRETFATGDGIADTGNPDWWKSEPPEKSPLEILVFCQVPSNVHSTLLCAL